MRLEVRTWLSAPVRTIALIPLSFYHLTGNLTGGIASERLPERPFSSMP